MMTAQPRATQFRCINCVSSANKPLTNVNNKNTKDHLYKSYFTISSSESEFFSSSFISSIVLFACPESSGRAGPSIFSSKTRLNFISGKISHVGNRFPADSGGGKSGSTAILRGLQGQIILQCWINHCCYYSAKKWRRSLQTWICVHFN